MTRVQVLIDESRALFAQYAGKQVEIAMLLDDRDSAQRWLREMEAAVEARKAMREVETEEA